MPKQLKRADSVIVSQYGEAWKLSGKAYKTMLQTIVDGKEYDLDVLGKHIGRVVEPLDWAGVKAQETLDTIKMQENVK